jgi:hypothetical protein
MAFNLNGLNFNESLVDSEGHLINTWFNTFGQRPIHSKTEDTRTTTIATVVAQREPLTVHTQHLVL